MLVYLKALWAFGIYLAKTPVAQIVGGLGLCTAGASLAAVGVDAGTTVFVVDRAAAMAQTLHQF